MHEQKKILIFLGGGGGRTFQALALVDQLGKDYLYFYIIPEKEDWVQNKIKIPGKIIRVTKFYLKDDNLIKIIIKIIKYFWESFFIVRDMDPYAVIAIGDILSFPFCFWGKILKKKVIFFESIARVTKSSLVAKAIYRLRISDKFLVQWPELKREFPRAIYKGRVL